MGKLQQVLQLDVSPLKCLMSLVWLLFFILLFFSSFFSLFFFFFFFLACLFIVSMEIGRCSRRCCQAAGGRSGIIAVCNAAGRCVLLSDADEYTHKHTPHTAPHTNTQHTHALKS